MGKFIFASKKRYEGEWLGGRQHGKGTLFDESGTMIKKGMWKEGKYDG